MVACLKNWVTSGLFLFEASFSRLTDRSTNWRKDLKILELDENHLRVAVMRDNSEGAWWLIWNFDDGHGGEGGS